MILLELLCFLFALPSVLSYYDSSYGIENHISGNNSSDAYVPLKSIKARCETAEDCEPENSECIENYCGCREGYILDGSFTKCLKVATIYNDKCESSIQCSKFLSPGGLCDNEICTCMDGYHYIHGYCHKTKGLNEPCSSDDECYFHTDYEAAICDGKEGRCKCAPGFYQREYSTCRPLVKPGKNCILDSDCEQQKEKRYKCQKNKCTETSASASVSLPNESISFSERKSDAKVGSACLTNDDCSEIGNSYCGADQKCTCDRAHFPSNDQAHCLAEIGEPCTSSSTAGITYSECSPSNRWTCNYNRVSLKNNQLCRKITTKFGGSCQAKENCQLFGPRSECKSLPGQRGMVCVCDSSSHFVEKESFCWINKKINELCQQDNDCYPPEGSPRTVCKNINVATPDVKVCTCPHGTSASDKGTYCIKDTPELNSYCEIQEDCKIDNSMCSNNKCLCRQNYFESKGKCLAGLYASCKADKDCKLKNTACTKNVCQCKKDFVGSPNNECVPSAEINETCEFDVQCTYKIGNSHCFIENTEETTPTVQLKAETNPSGLCKCLPDYYFHLFNCYKKKSLGELCTRKSECFSEDDGTDCRNGACECKFGYQQQNQTCKYTGDGVESAKPWLALLLATSLFALKSLR